MTTLGRPAQGLPRYYMDVGWYRHPRFLGLPPDVLFVFEAMVGYCYDHSLSGDVPADPEILAIALSIKPALARKALVAFKERGIVENIGHEVHIRNWEEHNPTAEEMKKAANEKSAAGSFGNHKRWHVDRGVIADGCPHCESH